MLVPPATPPETTCILKSGRMGSALMPLAFSRRKVNLVSKIKITVQELLFSSSCTVIHKTKWRYSAVNSAISF